jgi:hypothetical protein
MNIDLYCHFFSVDALQNPASQIGSRAGLMGVVGTEYPMAVGDFDSVDKILQLQLSDGERADILGGNAKKPCKFSSDAIIQPGLSAVQERIIWIP